MGRLIFILSTVIVLGVAGYMYWYYYNPYSEGYREGVLQKFSRRGNLFKTYEGECIQLGFRQRGGALNSQYYYFSVDDERLADTLEKSIGKIVKLHYIQYRRNLPWRGENYDKLNSDKGQYVVDALADVRTDTY